MRFVAEDDLHEAFSLFRCMSLSSGQSASPISGTKRQAESISMRSTLPAVLWIACSFWCSRLHAVSCQPIPPFYRNPLLAPVRPSKLAGRRPQWCRRCGPGSRPAARPWTRPCCRGHASEPAYFSGRAIAGQEMRTRRRSRRAEYLGVVRQEPNRREDIAVTTGKRLYVTPSKRTTGGNHIGGLVPQMFDTFPLQKQAANMPGSTFSENCHTPPAAVQSVCIHILAAR